MHSRPPRHPQLRALVELLWLGHGESWGSELMLPSARIHLAVRACGTAIDIDGVRRSAAVIGGLRTRSYVRRLPGAVASAGLVLAPGAAARLRDVVCRRGAPRAR